MTERQMSLGAMMMGVVHAEGEGGGIIGDVLVAKRSIVAGVKGDAGAAGLMALGAIGVEIGAGTLLEEALRLVTDGKLLQGW